MSKTAEFKLWDKVCNKNVYHGNEVFIVVGITLNELNLYGDWSGGTNPQTAGASWEYVEDGWEKAFGKCENNERPGGCQLPNIHCGAPQCWTLPEIDEKTKAQITRQVLNSNTPKP